MSLERRGASNWACVRRTRVYYWERSGKDKGSVMVTVGLGPKNDIYRPTQARYTFPMTEIDMGKGPRTFWIEVFAGDNTCIRTACHL